MPAKNLTFTLMANATRSADAYKCDRLGETLLAWRAGACCLQTSPKHTAG
jgi:hypothetical protein